MTSRYKPPETVRFMNELVDRCAEIRVFRSDVAIPDGLYPSDPDRCCHLLKVEPVSRYRLPSQAATSAA